MEHLLNALVACPTSSMVYHAAARGIRLEEVESELRGNLDLRGFLGISNEVRKGFQDIHVTFRVKGDASAEELQELCQFSPVFDVVSHGSNVTLEIQKREAAQEHPREYASTGALNP